MARRVSSAPRQGSSAEGSELLVKGKKKTALVIAAILGNAGFSHPVRAADLDVTISNIRNDLGFVDVTLYDHAEGWLDDSHAVGNLTLKAHAGDVRAVFHRLKPGQYAIVTTHDENGNGRMDFFLGLPTEGYAFSNDVRPFLSAPSFNRAAFRVGAADCLIHIDMVYPFAGKPAKERH